MHGSHHHACMHIVIIHVLKRIFTLIFKQVSVLKLVSFMVFLQGKFVCPERYYYKLLNHWFFTHLGIKTANSQADSELIAVEDSDLEETNLISSHKAMEDSRAFDSEGAANQTCPSPTPDSESEGEEVNLMSCVDVHYEKRDGLHGVLTPYSLIHMVSSDDPRH